MKTIILAAVLAAVATPAFADSACRNIPSLEVEVQQLEYVLADYKERENLGNVSLHRWRMMKDGKAPPLASAYYLLGLVDADEPNSRDARNLQGALRSLSIAYQRCFGGMY